jgi:hypothetical protein
MRRIMVLGLVLVLALLVATPAFAGSCKDFGHAWAEFGQSGQAGAIVSSLASNGDADGFPVADGPGVLARIIHWEMEVAYPCD